MPRTIFTSYAVAWLYRAGFIAAQVAYAALSPHDQAAVLGWASTNVHNLRHHPVGSLVASAFVTQTFARGKGCGHVIEAQAACASGLTALSQAKDLAATQAEEAPLGSCQPRHSGVMPPDIPPMTWITLNRRRVLIPAYPVATQRPGDSGEQAGPHGSRHAGNHGDRVVAAPWQHSHLV